MNFDKIRTLKRGSLLKSEESITYYYLCFTVDTDCIVVENINEGSIHTLTEDELEGWEIRKLIPEICSIYEVFKDNGTTVWLNDNGEEPIWPKKHFIGYAPHLLKRKTGRELKLNLDTWEIVND